VVNSSLSPPQPPSVLTDAVAPYDDIAVSVCLTPAFVIAVPVTTAPTAATLPIPVSVSIPPVAAIVPIPIHSRLRRNAPCETAGEKASSKYNW
jgi:hypothetical protein